MGMMSGLPNAKPTVLSGGGEATEGVERAKCARTKKAGWCVCAYALPAVDNTVELHGVVLPALGHSAHVLVDASQH